MEKDKKLDEEITITRKELIALLTSSTIVYVKKVFEVDKEKVKEGLLKFNTDFVIGEFVDNVYFEITKKKLCKEPFSLEKGSKVHYQPEHYGNRFKNGIVKSISLMDGKVFVVYNCGGDWDNYKNYTGAATDIRDLKGGWKNED